jgi:hypothetical protein
MKKSKGGEVVGTCESRGGDANDHKILFVNVGRKRFLEEPMRRWECNIEMGVGEIGWECVDWIFLPQDRDQ